MKSVSGKKFCKIVEKKGWVLRKITGSHNIAILRLVRYKFLVFREQGAGSREEGKGKREEGRGKREEGRGKREEGKNNVYLMSPRNAIFMKSQEIY